MNAGIANVYVFAAQSPVSNAEFVIKCSHHTSINCIAYVVVKCCL